LPKANFYYITSYSKILDYIKVKGKWAYLYRTLDKDGNTVDLYLSSTRGINAAKRFLSEALKSAKKYAYPSTIKCMFFIA
jgi:transposase-like protein